MSHARIAQRLADTLVLGSLLEEVRAVYGSYDLLAHWQQGEFHHDVLLSLTTNGAPRFVVVATNCNGGVKEVLCFDELPTRLALWHWRCPASPEFTGDLHGLLGTARTTHWFDPCELLLDSARSEIREEFRKRVPGGGWEIDVSARGCGRG